MAVSCFKRLAHCPHDTGEDAITLDYETRNRSRGKSCSREGVEVAWFLERGEFLRHGDCLVSEAGEHVAICAAPETVSKVTADNDHLMTRIAYHLGNRHVPLQVERSFLLYQPDHVLDDMVRGLGLEPVCEQAAFEPEPGAYGEHHSGHAHGSHSHGHSHSHAH